MTRSLHRAVPLLVLAACSDAGVTKHNAAPTASIVSHTGGDTVREGDTVALRGKVGDNDHDASSLLVDWVVDGTVACGALTPDPDGNVSCDAVFSEGGGVVQLDVSDPTGTSGSARVDLEVMPTDAPVATIDSPTATGRYYADQLITFSGTVSDTEDGPGGLTVTWETDADGDLGLSVDVTSSGDVEAFGSLPEGEHVVRLRAVDSDAKEARDSVVIEVGPANTAPDCAITGPTDGTAVAEGGELRFEGSVSDVDVAADWLSVTWESDVDGVLRESTPDSDGTVGFATTTMSKATHRVTLTVADEVGATCTDSVYVTVGTPPELVIEAPSSGDVVNEGERVTFTASVSDTEDVATDIGLVWESDLDGTLSTARADSTGTMSFSAADLSAGDHRITVTATDTDELFTIRTVDLTVNSVPTAPTVTLTPDPATTTDALTASASGSTDPDGSGSITYAYTWYENGVLSSTSTSAVFPSSATTKHSTYTVEVTPGDGVGFGPSTQASVTIDNSVPVLTGPTLSASSAVVGDVLTCTASATDADPADTPVITYTWSDGSTGTTYAVSSSDNPGDAITCTATADDGDGGTVSASASATVTNTSPVLTGVSVSPSSGQVGDTLTCSGTATDADGDALTTTYAWSDGSTGSTTTITSSSAPGSTLTCTMTVTDPSGAAVSDTASATVDNTNPVVGTVSISPSPATNSDTLTCSGSATDADAGTPSLAYTWTDGSGSTLGTSASLDLTSAGVASLDTVTCTITATDTDGGTGTGSAALTVTNRDPSLSVAISPSGSVSSGDTLTCAASATDPDGDTVSTSYSWAVDGATVSSGTSLSGVFSVGETVTCTATSTDGKGGSASASASVSVTNDAPTVSGVTLTPTPLYTNSTASVSATVSDADGDPVTTTYNWYVGGSLVQSGSSTTLSGTTWFDKADTVRVDVVATDGVDTTTVSSSTVTVQNSPPTGVTVAIDPEEPLENNDLFCDITTASTDADGDTITYSFAWTRNGSAFTGASTTAYTGDTIDFGDTVALDSWVCTVTPSDGSTTGTADSDSVTVLDWAGERELTTCGATGRTGPSQSSCDTEYAGTTLDGEISVSSGIQQWTVPSTGDYVITAYGAQGAAGDATYVGGYGAVAEGTFSLTAGDVLYIVVGQEGTGQSSGSNGGGGGGTFVVDAATGAPLVVAGGGGGTREAVSQDGCDATSSEYGVQGSGGSTTSSCSNKTTSRTLGGIISSSSWGSGGAGFYGNGASESSWGGVGGYQWSSGMYGGDGGTCGFAAAGGFGGGGSGNGCYGGGGGGGYSGGDGGRVAGGGGSFVDSSATGIVKSGGYNPGEGWVTIDLN